MNRLLLVVLVPCLLAPPLALAKTQVASAIDTAHSSKGSAVTTPTTTAGDSSTKGGDTLGKGTAQVVNSAFVLWPYLLLVLLIACVPIILDMAFTHRTRVKIAEAFKKMADDGKLTPDQLKENLQLLSEGPSGIRGLSRTVMALAVIAVMGVCVFHVLVFYHTPDGQVSPILGNVLSILGGMISAITGFYFGGRASTEGASAGSPQTPPTPSGPAKPNAGVVSHDQG